EAKWLPCEKEEAEAVPSENEEAATHTREGNPNLSFLSYSLLAKHLSAQFFFPFNKGVGSYNTTQSNHYNINLIYPSIQPLFLNIVIINYMFICLICSIF
ncbi:hypothetical protein VIGAN_05169200, partial [Vigna angularis var. angularis]